MRKELKYEISYQEWNNIKSVLDRVLKQDKHSNENGEYNIRSVYFDNHFHEIENAKLNHLNSVKKYRIRMYNDDENVIFLERKSNENGYIQKVKQRITKEDVVNILRGKLQGNSRKRGVFENRVIFEITAKTI